jgi:hypothetical protein
MDHPLQENTATVLLGFGGQMVLVAPAFNMKNLSKGSYQQRNFWGRCGQHVGRALPAIIPF